MTMWRTTHVMYLVYNYNEVKYTMIAKLNIFNECSQYGVLYITITRIHIWHEFDMFTILVDYLYFNVEKIAFCE